MMRTLSCLTAGTTLALAGIGQAAVVDLDVSSPTFATTTNASTNALRVSADTAATPAGNKFPELQFAVQDAGLAAGSYTVTFDVLFIDKPDTQRAAMRRDNSNDNSDFNQVMITSSNLSSAALNQWYRVTAPVEVTSTDPTNLVWTGTFELRPTSFASGGGDTFDIWYDNVDLFDATNSSVLEDGPYTFESDTVGAAPADVSLIDADAATAFKVVAIPEPSSMLLAGLGVGLIVLRRRK
jgi:hypothetical protein